MAPTVTANDLRPLHPERAVRMPCHGARDAVEVCGPSAAGRELVGGFVEGRLAGRAGVDALSGLVFVEFAGEGGFGALFAEDAELFFIEDGAPFVVGFLDWERHFGGVG